MGNEINRIMEKLERELAYTFDDEVYQPTKNELAAKQVTHLLGMRKENWKSTVARLVSEAKRALEKLQ